VTAGILHITSGDCAGDSLSRSGVAGEVFVWRDVLYEGPRKPGWPEDDILFARAQFLCRGTGGRLSEETVLDTLRRQYRKLETAGEWERIVLWFDACLFDQSMLAHLLVCLRLQGIRDLDLLCVDAFPGIEPYNGLGQLLPEELASVYDRRRPVTHDQFEFAEVVDRSFALQDTSEFLRLAELADAPLPWIPAAMKRWLQELPDTESGLGRLEQFVVEAVRTGCETPEQIYAFASAAETPPQFWGDTTLWAKINDLADRQPPLVQIDGPNPRLPEWEGISDLKLFRVRPA
jgi:hypothetical protein